MTISPPLSADPNESLPESGAADSGLFPTGLPIDCESVTAALGAQMSGDLPAQDKARVDAHVAGCRACQKEAAGYRAVIALANTLTPPVVRPEVSARLLARLRQGVKTHESGSDPRTTENGAA